HQRRRLPLAVGGTLLYVPILLQGLCEAPPSDPAARARLCEESPEQGHEHPYARLAAVDPFAAAKLHPREDSQVIRELEVHYLAGVPMAAFQAGDGLAERPFAAVVIGLNREREHLYRRIGVRIGWQLANGLLEETRALVDRGYRRREPALTGLGY